MDQQLNTNTENLNFRNMEEEASEFQNIHQSNQSMIYDNGQSNRMSQQPPQQQQPRQQQQQEFPTEGMVDTNPSKMMIPDPSRNLPNETNENQQLRQKMFSNSVKFNSRTSQEMIQNQNRMMMLNQNYNRVTPSPVLNEKPTIYGEQLSFNPQLRQQEPLYQPIGQKQNPVYDRFRPLPPCRNNNEFDSFQMNDPNKQNQQRQQQGIMKPASKFNVSSIHKNAHLKVDELKSLSKKQMLMLEDHLKSPSIGQVNSHLKEFKEKLVKDRKRRYKRIGLTLLIGSFVTLILYDPFLDSIFDWQLQLSPGNVLTANWMNVPLPINLKFYLFGIRNGEQFLNGAPPYLVEYGPFVYSAGRKRTIKEWKDDTVIFTERFSSKFVPELSIPASTELTVLNLPIMATVSIIRYWMDRFMISFLNPILHNILVSILRITGESILEKRTAHELLEGRPLNVLVYLEYLVKPLKSLGVPIPDYALGNYRIDNQTFGFLPLVFGSELGPFEHYRRTENGHKMNQVIKILEESTYQNYKPPCNKVGGLDPLLFGTHLDAPSVEIYNQHACRRITFVRNKTHFVRGTYGVRYQVSERMFDMSIPENRCYCYGRPLKECDGFTDISGCFYGLPFGLSWPHFLGSPRLLSKVRGLRPNHSEHLSFMEMEPNLGLPFEAKIAIQLSLVVKAFTAVPGLMSVPTVHYPVVWISISLGAFGIMAVGVAILSFFLYFGKYLMFLGLLTLGTLFFYRSTKIK